MSALIVRAALPSEAVLVHRMIRALAAAVGEADRFTARVEDVRRDAFGADPRFEAWLAWLEARPAGLMSYYLTYSTYRGRPCLFIDTLYVEDWARGQSVGQALMAKVAALSLEQGCCRLDLHVRENNSARQFYESIGLGLCDELYYSIPEAKLKSLARA